MELSTWIAVSKFVEALPAIMNALAGLLGAVAWPIAVLVIAHKFRDPLISMIGRIKKAKGFGAELELIEKIEKAEATVLTSPLAPEETVPTVPAAQVTPDQPALELPAENPSAPTQPETAPPSPSKSPKFVALTVSHFLAKPEEARRAAIDNVYNSVAGLAAEFGAVGNDMKAVLTDLSNKKVLGAQLVEVILTLQMMSEEVEATKGTSYEPTLKFIKLCNDLVEKIRISAMLAKANKEQWAEAKKVMSAARS